MAVFPVKREACPGHCASGALRGGCVHGLWDLWGAAFSGIRNDKPGARWCELPARAELVQKGSAVSILGRQPPLGSGTLCPRGGHVY